MGTWGPSLYSCDIAADLRTMIGAVLKVPFDDEEPERHPAGCHLNVLSVGPQSDESPTR